jgi:hypothetical protein
MLWLYVIYPKCHQPLFEDARCEPLDCRDPFEDFNLGSSLVHLLFLSVSSQVYLNAMGLVA